MKFPQISSVFIPMCFVITGMMAPIPAAYAENEFTFKRIKVEKRPLGSRINIQIKPEESYYDKTPTENSHTNVEKTKTVSKPRDNYDWFWSDFSHDITGASLLRLNNAEQQLLKTPDKSNGLAPSLKLMRNLAKTYGTDILLATLNKDVSPAFVLAVMGVESHGVVDAVSSADAVGLMQLIPETAKRFNVEDRTDPKQNIAGGVAYLDWLINEFNRDPVLALAGYNAGENAVKLHKGVPPFAQTRGYIPKVVAAWNVAKALCKTPPKYATDGCVFDFELDVAQ